MAVARTGMAVAAVAVLAVAPGCAAIMRQPPKEDRRMDEAPICSTGRGGVVVDTLLAIGLGSGGVAAIEAGESDAALALFLLGGVFVGSAVAGHNSANRCEEAIVSYNNFEAAERAEARAEREDARQARATPPAPAAAPAPAPTSTPDSEPEPDPGSDPDSGSEPESDHDHELEHDHELDHDQAPERPTAQPVKPRKPPVPGTSAWRDFWIEVAP